MSPLLENIRQKLREHVSEGENTELISGICAYISTDTTCPVTALYEPTFCLILQGAKEVTVGDNIFAYAQGDFFINSVALPIFSRITQASTQEPYMVITMALDVDNIMGILSEISPETYKKCDCYGVNRADDALLDAWQRLFNLLNSPEDISFLAPMLKREILYRLLRGPQQNLLRQIAGSDGEVAKIGRAIQWIRDHYTNLVPVQKLTDLSGMSSASFHRHFKAATGMTPLQYQKQLRLQEARQLLFHGQDVAQAAYNVGYESPSQFSREYSRMFGWAPSIDSKRLRDTGVSAQVINHAPW